MDEELAAAEKQPEFTGLQRIAERLAQHWQKNFSFQAARPGVPVDIEIRRERRARAILQNVHPPGILATRGHVIGDDVQDDAHPALSQLVLKREEIFLGAQVRIDPRRVGGIIPMLAAVTTAQDWGRVNMRDAKVAQRIQDSNRVFKSKVAVELQTIRRGRNRRRGAGAFRAPHFARLRTSPAA